MARQWLIAWFIHLAPAIGLVGCLLAPGNGMARGSLSLEADDLAAGDMFGYSVAISGPTAIIGARLDDTDAGINAGSAYVFDTVFGEQLFKLTAEDAEPADFFGRSVAVSDESALIGAAGNDDAGTDSGSAYLFDTTNGRQRHKLNADDASVSDQFGYTVALSGNTAVVAAPWEDEAATNGGAVYVFNAATGVQHKKLTVPDTGAGDLFGISLAASGNMALVGSMSDGAGIDSGSAYLFNTDTGELLHTLIASDTDAGDKFGYVALDGNLALIGAPGSDAAAADAGAAYLFDVTTGNELFQLKASDATAGSKFGFSVALSGNLALIGAYGDNNETGTIYGFDALTGNELFKFTPAGGPAGEAFGFALGLDDLTAVVGSPLADTPGPNAGSALLIELPPPPEPIVGDLDHDGFVGIQDLNYLLLFWNKNAGYRQDQDGDITGDGFVGIDDLNFMLANWNEGMPPTSNTSTIPEPGTCLVMLALLPCVRRRGGRAAVMPDNEAAPNRVKDRS